MHLNMHDGATATEMKEKRINKNTQIKKLSLYVCFCWIEPI